MRGYLILHVVHIVGTIMIEEVIYGVSRVNNMGGMTRGFLKLVLLHGHLLEVPLALLLSNRLCFYLIFVIGGTTYKFSGTQPNPFFLN